MSHKLLAVLIVLAVAIVIAALIVVSRLQQARRQRQNIVFRERWQRVQGQCRDPKQWRQALIDADGLLHDALKAAGCRGRTMGERMVSAQRRLTDNDGVWFGHKLRNRQDMPEVEPLTKSMVQQALRGLQQALKDLGAL